MRSVKVWLLGTFLAAAMVGLGMLLSTASTSRAAAERAEEMKSHWRHFDGHWSRYDDQDKRWYYTDGSHWFYNDGDNWQLYKFDKEFGREGFERGEYKVPEEGKYEKPRHGVWHPK